MVVTCDLVRFWFSFYVINPAIRDQLPTLLCDVPLVSGIKQFGTKEMAET